MEEQRSPIKQQITRRAWVIYWLFVLFGLLIVGRILLIQYGPEGSARREKARDTRTFRTSVIEAERGDILAYDGRLLATSSPYYDLKMDFRATGLTDSIFNLHVDALSQCMSDFFRDKSKQEYKNLFVSNRGRATSAQRVFRIAPRRVSHYELSKIRRFPLLSYANANVSGFLPEKVHRRVLPYGSIARRTIGRPSENGNQGVGIEGAFDRELKGTNGVTRMQRISGSFWMPVGDENNRDPEDGCDVVSTIDIELQDVAERALRAQLQETHAYWGTAVLMEVTTGRIRAMANLTRRDDGTCVEDLNHAIAQRINPGSTFKLANLIVLLEDAGMSLDEVIDINYGTKWVGPRPVYDSHPGPKTLTLKEVFLQSSNVGFAQAMYDHYRDADLRTKTNQQRYIDQLTQLGVRDTLPFQIEGLRGPNVHDTKASTWSDWSIPSMAYGYEVEMTPLQTLVLYNTVANDGKMMAPLIVEELRKYGGTVKTYAPEVLRSRIASPKTLALVQDCLRDVAVDGTAKSLQIKDLEIAVKTGTAQIPNRNRGYGTNDYLATLAGYFPAKDPKYSLIVAIQTDAAASGGIYYGGSLAGPVFRKIAERVYGSSVEWNPPVARQRPPTDDRPPVKGGEYREVRRILDRMDIAYQTESRSNGWVSVHSDSAGIRMTPLETADTGTVPDVTGLGLRDAIRLLEGRGMSVRFSGRGSVTHQSAAPGAAIRPGQEIHLTLALR